MRYLMALSYSTATRLAAISRTFSSAHRTNLTNKTRAMYYPRHRYAGWYAQDSWRIKPNLTFNYGLRMELMRYWSEKYDQVPTFKPGEQSVVYPNAFPGLVYPTDPGIPSTLVPEKFRYAPRVGIAYSPNKSSGLLGKVFGGPGKTSIRASYGIFNTVIQGNTIGVDEPQPPYGLSGTVYNGLFAAPYNLADGTLGTTPYPLTFPPLNARASHPNTSVIFNGIYNPQSGMTAPMPGDTYPYTENYFLSIERQLPGQTVLSLSYVGSQSHHQLLVYSANPGNPALCLALNQPGVLAAGESCGPGGENNEYNLAKAVHIQRGHLSRRCDASGYPLGIKSKSHQQQRDREITSGMMTMKAASETRTTTHWK